MKILLNSTLLIALCLPVSLWASAEQAVTTVETATQVVTSDIGDGMNCPGVVAVWAMRPGKPIRMQAFCLNHPMMAVRP